MKQHTDLKADATFYYVNLPYSELETDFHTSAADLGISDEVRGVLELIWLRTRCFLLQQLVIILIPFITATGTFSPIH